MAGPGAMQVRGGGDDRRAFNPDRDLVWAMGRLVKRLGTKMAERLHDENGEIMSDEYMKMLQDFGIYAPWEHKQKYARYFKEFVHALNDYFQRLHGDMEAPENELTKPLDEMFNGYQYAAPRALFSIMLAQEIFAEHPFWWAQVQPQSDAGPRPRIKEINEAVRAILGTPEA